MSSVGAFTTADGPLTWLPDIVSWTSLGSMAVGWSTVSSKLGEVFPAAARAATNAAVQMPVLLVNDHEK